MNGRLHIAVAQGNGRFLVGLDVFVKNEIQPRCSGNHIEHLAQIRLTELDGNGLAECGRKALVFRRGGRHLAAQFSLQAQCVHMAGVLLQHFVQPGGGLYPILLVAGGVGLVHQLGQRHLRAHFLQAVVGRLVAGIQLQHPLVGFVCVSPFLGLQQTLALPQEVSNGTFAGNFVGVFVLG